MTTSVRIECDGCGASIVTNIGPGALALPASRLVLFLARLTAIGRGWAVGDGAFRDACPACLALYDKPPVRSEAP
jgi:hypothetical protein